MAVAASEQNGTRERNGESNFTNLYVKCFPQQYVEEDICDLFGGYGPIQAVKVMTDPRGRKSAFVNFEKHEDARFALEDMHRKDLRPRAERKAAAKAEKEGNAAPVVADADGHPEHLLFVSRAQSKAERQAMFEQKGASSKGSSFAKGKGKEGTAKGEGKGEGMGSYFYGNGGGRNTGLGNYGGAAAPSMSAAATSLQPGFSAYSAATTPRQPPCSFQQQQQYVQQPPYVAANHYGDSESASYDARAGYYGGSYAMNGGNGGYGAYTDNNNSQPNGNYYAAWGAYSGDGTFGDGRTFARESF